MAEVHYLSSLKTKKVKSIRTLAQLDVMKMSSVAGTKVPVPKEAETKLDITFSPFKNKKVSVKSEK